MFNLFEDLFFNWPESPKPPIDQFPVYEDDKLLGWKIQMAVAGFNADNLSVRNEDQRLIIEGDNTKADIAPKFKTRFKHQITIAKRLSVDKAEVSLENGILSIFLPINEEKSVGRLLFGK